MSLEDLTGPNKFIYDLVETNPEGSDLRSEGDDHIRGVKNVLKNTFPNLSGAVTLTQDEINDLYDNDSPGWTKDELVVWARAWIGMIAFWPKNTPPDGWLACDGGGIDATNYPELRNLVGAFTPDLRGLFVRGYDLDGLRDPEGPQRQVGVSIQAPATGEHYHTQTAIAQQPQDLVVYGRGTPINDLAGGDISNEARPVNIAMMYIIKHDDIPARIAP